jgi:hypothetical protein
MVAKRTDLEPLIIGEWLKRPVGKRTENDVLQFYGFLKKIDIMLCASVLHGRYELPRFAIRTLPPD